MSKVKQNFSAQRRIIKDLAGFIFFQHHASCLWAIWYYLPYSSQRTKEEMIAGENVKMISEQPPLRIVFFETKRLFVEKSAFLRQVDKYLSISTLSFIPLLGDVIFGSKIRHPYRISATIPIGYAVPSLEDGTAYPIGMGLPFL